MNRFIYNQQKQIAQIQRSMNQKNFQSHFGYLSHRSINQKISSNSPTSGNNIQTSFQKTDKQPNQNSKKVESDQLNTIHKQNSILKQENRILKRELNYYRAENLLQSTAKDGKNQVNDLRETIKKQAGQIKDLKTRLQMLSKQCKMYEDIIDKMQLKINKLIQQNSSLQEQINFKGKIDKNQPLIISSQKNCSLNEKEALQKLNQKVANIVGQFQELEAKFVNENSEWQRWKDHWTRQKSYYMHRIQDLQGMMGISNEYGDFSKSKRY